MLRSESVRVDLGDCRVTLVSGGAFKLDGGAMFGLIPKVLWAQHCPADDQNRIPLACNCLLVEWTDENDRRVIIETGHGAKYSEKEQRIFAIDPEHWLLPSLRRLAVEPETITDVVVTHLHFDHAGGLTWLDDGRPVPTFPRATVHIQRRELEDARSGFGIMTATYRPENYAPLETLGLWHLLDGSGPVMPGVNVLLTPGHTRGHQSVVVTGRQRSLVFAGDLMPTRHHLGPAYNMAYDLFPLDNRQSKHELLGWLADNDGLLVLDHEREIPIVAVRRTREWFELVPAPGIETVAHAGG